MSRCVVTQRLFCLRLSEGVVNKVSEGAHFEQSLWDCSNPPGATAGRSRWIQPEKFGLKWAPGLPGSSVLRKRSRQKVPFAFANGTLELET